MGIVKLFDETTIVRELIDDSLELIHSTRKLAAIKLLVTITEMLELNLAILEKFAEAHKAWGEAGSFLYWDKASLKELNYSRCALVLLHRPDFDPIRAVDIYNVKADRFIRMAESSIGDRLVS